MKRLISLFLILVLVFALAPAATGAEADIQPSSQAFRIDGGLAPLKAVNIDGYNYVRLRDLAMLLRDTDCRFAVGYDAAAGTVSLTTGGEYEPVGGELPETVAAVHVGQLSPQTILVDGKERSDLTVWLLDGYNYFQLRELSPLLGFSVGYNEENRCVIIGTAGAQESGVRAAESYEEVLEHISGAADSRGVYVTNGVGVEEEAEMPAAPAEAPAPAPTAVPAAADTSKAVGAAESAEGVDYSGTNTQVADVDEGDIVKTDGAYIYALSNYGVLTIVKAQGADSTVVSRTQLEQETYEDRENGYFGESRYPREMYISDGLLTVISDYYRYEESKTEEGWSWDNEDCSFLDVYDVSDPTAPKLLRTLGQSGDLLSSRMLDGLIYVVTREWVYSVDEDDPNSYVPVLYADGVKTAVVPECIYLCGSSTEYVTAAVYDPATGETNVQTLLGSGDELYMSAESLYVLGSEWSDEAEESYTESVYTVTKHRSGSKTTIYRFEIGGGALRLAAEGSVPGYIDSQFSADEYQGFFRIVTTQNESFYTVYEDEEYGFINQRWDGSSSSTGLYILDSALERVGAVTDLAEGERVYSARFDGDIAYFTTFRNVDPLFAADLSDPAHPVILSALKISGFSEYLHKWSEGRLLGIGREASEENGWAEELKLVMFNTEDKTDVTAEKTLLLEDAYYSQALYDHKAIFIDPAKNIIGFAGDDSDYYIFSYDDQNGFRELAHFWFDTYEYNTRGLFIGSDVYIVGSEQMMVLNMNDWSAEPVGVRLSEE